MLRKVSINARLVLYVVVVLVAALFLPASALAHKPLFVQRDISGFEQALPIPDPAVSYAVYGELKSLQQVDVYSVTIPQEMPFYLRLSVPNRPGAQSFAPALVVFGPGLRQFDQPPQFPLQLPDTGRAVVLANGAADSFFEPFTQTSLLQRQFFSKRLTPGTYYIAVYDPNGKFGKYVLTTGGQERFSLADWLSFPLIWFQVRMWYDAQQTWMILGFGALAIAGLLLFWRNLRTRGQ